MASQETSTNVTAQGSSSVERTTHRRSFDLLRKVLRARLAPAALGVLLALILCAVFAEVLAPYHPITDQSYSSANEGPSAAHWFGTDYLGRDTLSRLIFGARISLMVAALAVSIGLVCGVTIGVIGGFYGGKVDMLLMRCTDAIWTFPALMLALAITSALGRGVNNAIIAIGIVNIPYFARLARASTLTAREMDFVTAARALGAPAARTIFWHILPNIAAPIIVQGSLAFGVAITTEASLSFLGVGVQAPTPSWGIELRSGYQYMELNPSTAIFPGLAIFLTVLSFNFLGDGLRSALDPRLSRRGEG
ncbi:MAG: ABC transporter permease [Chloroflexota bacterium]